MKAFLTIAMPLVSFCASTQRPGLKLALKNARSIANTNSLTACNENDGLRTEIVRLRRELENREGAVGHLELLLRERLTSRVGSATKDSADELPAYMSI